MRKILSFVVIGVLILSGLGASAIIVKEESYETSNSDRATHTVLGEFGTSTSCPYCKYAHGALMELYADGQLDFKYITHVYNKNTVSSSYLKSHYNLYGYPTLWWDGGRDIDVGAGSIPSAKSTYTYSINYCGSRVVEDIDINLAVTWLGATDMKVKCTVTNNEPDTYGGTIQVAICEKVSSRGWKDAAGVLYTMPFLDWAFNDPLSISSGGSWSDSMNWNGISHGYPTVTKDNIIVIGAVYNDEWHQGYSYPPSNNPFDAYYIDECISTEPKTVDQAHRIPVQNGLRTGITGISYRFLEQLSQLFPIISKVLNF